MSLLRQFAGQTIIYGIGNVLSRILYFLVLSSYLTRKLTDTYEYGLYSEMYAYATLIVVLLSYRIDTAFFRFGSKEGELNKSLSSAFLPLVVTTIIAIVGFLFFKDGLASLLGLGKYPHYFVWFALILSFDTLTLVPFAKLRLTNKAFKFMLYKILNILISIGLIFYFLEFYDIENGWLSRLFPSVNLMVDLVFISNLIASALLFLMLLSELKGIRFKIDFGLWKKMIMYSAPLIIVGIANSINQFFSTPLQHAFLPYTGDENLAQAGIYAAAMRIAALLVMFNTAFNYAAEPFFFKNAEQHKDKNIYGKVILLYVIVATLAILGLVFFIDFVQLIIGRNYRDAMFVVPILLFAYLMLGIYYNVSIWYKIADKTYYGSLISIVGVVITLIVSVFLLPVVGYAASAWAALLCYSTMVCLAILLGRIHYPIQYPFKSIIGIILITILLILFSLWVDNYFSVIIAVAIKSILYLLYVVSIVFKFKPLLSELFIKPKQKMSN